MQDARMVYERLQDVWCKVRAVVSHVLRRSFLTHLSATRLPPASKTNATHFRSVHTLHTLATSRNTPYPAAQLNHGRLRKNKCKRMGSQPQGQAEKSEARRQLRQAVCLFKKHSCHYATECATRAIDKTDHTAKSACPPTYTSYATCSVA